MIKNVLIGAFILLSFCACDPDKWLSGHQGLWYLKNTTDITLEITYPSIRMDSMTIVPGDSICIYRSNHYLGDNEFPEFDNFLELDSIYVYDAGGNKLCEWLKQNMEVEERNVFKENVWIHCKEHIAGPEYAFIWVYDICNDDIDN